MLGWVALSFVLAWSAYDSTPKPAASELSGPFDVALAESGTPGTDGTVCHLFGDGHAGTAERTTRLGVFSGALSATDVKALLEGSQRLRFWALNDADANVQDGTAYTASLQEGATSRAFRVQQACPGSRAEPCPQMELIALVKKACAAATTKNKDPELADQVDEKDVFNIVIANMASVRACSEHPGKDPLAPREKLVMKWTVRTNGKAANLEVVEDEVKSPRVSACISKLIKTWSFPPTKTQGPPVTFTFTL